jgi:PAS domain-containing protein
MVGQNIRRLIPAELQSEEDEILARLRAGRFIDHLETVRMTKDGRRLHVSLSISPIRNSAGEIVGAAKIARDITARKVADELTAATAKFESVFNQAGIFAGICDVEGNLREVNDLAVDQCGYTRRRCARPAVLGHTVVARLGRRSDADPLRRGAGRRRGRLSREAPVLDRGRERAHRRPRDAPDPRRARAGAVPAPDRGRHHRAHARGGGAPRP